MLDGSRHYYNEIDPYCVAWLRNLMDAGHIPAGDIDTRSIEDVRPDELAGYTQCHFFAGIAGWPLALALAGWPVDRPVWTGSCPCQPFSAAGKGDGFADERHLWPAWQHLIAQCRPPVIFGEQVASKAAEPWIDLVHADLEGMGYAFGCVPLPAAGIGAPHIRDRTYWVGVGLADAADQRQHGRRSSEARDGRYAARIEPERLCDAGERGSPGPTNGFWRAADWLFCTDGRWRPVEPGLEPLAHGAPARVGRLRAYGNAIVPQVAAEFIARFVEVIGEESQALERAA